MVAVPRAVSRTLWLPAKSFDPTAGSPTTSSIASRWRGFALDDTGGEIVACAIPLPAFWLTMDVDLYWTVIGTPAGGADTVRWVTNLDRAGDGEPLTVSGGGGQSLMSIVAPAQNVLKVSRVFTARAVDPTKLLNVRVQRDASHVEDTMVGDAALIGVKLRRGQASNTVDL